MKKATNTKARNVNTHGEMRFSSLLKIIKAVQNNSKSKNDIKRDTGLSWGSCSEIITLLEDKKIIVPDKGDVAATGKQGRKAIRYVFNNKRHLLFGMEIKPREINCSISNWGKAELYHKSYPQKEDIDGKNIFKIISNAYINALVDFGLKSEQIMGLTLALIGGVNPDDCKWTFSSRIKNIQHLDLRPLLSTLPSLKYLRLEHDINAQASSVLRKNNQEKELSYAFVNIGEGVGMSLFNHGIYTGARGFAGEIGHIPYPAAEYTTHCSCGQDNCIETILSTEGILAYINQEFNQKFKALSEAGTYLRSEKVFNRISNALTYLMIAITNMLDPQILIVGGEALEYFYDGLQPEVENAVRKKSWLNGPPQIKWFDKKDMNCAQGSILNSSDYMIEKYIKDHLL